MREFPRWVENAGLGEMPGDAQLPFCHGGEKFWMAESGAW